MSNIIYWLVNFCWFLHLHGVTGRQKIHTRTVSHSWNFQTRITNEKKNRKRERKRKYCRTKMSKHYGRCVWADHWTVDRICAHAEDSRERMKTKSLRKIDCKRFCFCSATFSGKWMRRQIKRSIFRYFIFFFVATFVINSLTMPFQASVLSIPSVRSIGD